ncbi:transposon Tf2-9 polyprotein [Trichonephila clavipes]|nr:transposon Tf2-9 polyprotein [Trichonephila clavipes]
MHMFQKIHNLAHLGVKSTVKQIASRFIWLNIRKDANQWAKSCIQCQKNKINRHTHSQIGTFQEVDDRFSVIHVDIIGPFPVSEGKINCLTCIDRFTCWLEVIPLSNITAETVAREFYNHWISRFGMPYRVITDPGLRSALRSDTNYTIAQIVYGQTIRLPGEFFEKPKNVLDLDTFAEELQKQMDQLQPLKTRRQPSQKHFVHKDLHNSTHVFIRVDRVKKALEPPYDGPFPVAKRYDKYFTVKIKGKDINIFVDRLKRAYLLSTDGDNHYHFKQLEMHQLCPKRKLIVQRKI